MAIQYICDWCHEVVEIGGTFKVTTDVTKADEPGKQTLGCQSNHVCVECMEEFAVFRLNRHVTVTTSES